MQITWKDAYARGLTAKIAALLPGGTDLGDELSENIDTDLIILYDDEADGEGELSVEFYDLEPVNPDDENPVEPEVKFCAYVPVNNAEATVACKGTRVSYSVEECTMEFRGEPLTYFHYKATYTWVAVAREA